MIDIDSFKFVNDLYGHVEGIKLSSLLQGQLRALQILLAHLLQDTAEMSSVLYLKRTVKTQGRN